MSVREQIFDAIEREEQRQKNGLEMIASENFVSDDVRRVCGSVLTNKYAEGYPGKRYYGGCAYYDEIENLARNAACDIFGAAHANVQPHSGATANFAAYTALLRPGDKVVAMSLDHGGHLTHGSKVNFSGRLYDMVPYGVEADTGRIDYDKLEALVEAERPKLLVAGASAYAREINFKRMGAIAKQVGAKFMVDMAHIAGLVATGYHQNPVPYADVVTSTTHKTLRGPRGGLILCTSELAKKIDSRVFPGAQGGPLMHQVAAKAICFAEAKMGDFKTYQMHVVENAKVLAESLSNLGYDLVSGGTDNHLVLVDLRPKGVTGADAEHALEAAGMTTNKNKIPFDPMSAQVTSGLRLGTPALTTRGMDADAFRQIASWIDQAISSREDAQALHQIRLAVDAFAQQFPMFCLNGERSQG